MKRNTKSRQSVAHILRRIRRGFNLYSVPEISTQAEYLKVIGCLAVIEERCKSLSIELDAYYEAEETGADISDMRTPYIRLDAYEYAQTHYWSAARNYLRGRIYTSGVSGITMRFPSKPSELIHDEIARLVHGEWLKSQIQSHDQAKYGLFPNPDDPQLTAKAAFQYLLIERLKKSNTARTAHEGRLVICAHCSIRTRMKQTERIKPYKSDRYVRLCEKCAKAVKAEKALYARRWNA